MVTCQSHMEVRMDLTGACSRQNIPVNVRDCVFLVVLVGSEKPERNSTHTSFLNSVILNDGRGENYLLHRRQQLRGSGNRIFLRKCSNQLYLCGRSRDRKIVFMIEWVLNNGSLYSRVLRKSAVFLGETFVVLAGSWNWSSSSSWYCLSSLAPGGGKMRDPGNEVGWSW